MKFLPNGILGLFAIALLNACAAPLDAAVLQSATYHQGYNHGCMTATKQSNGFQSEIVENRALMDSDDNYKIGWRQGFYGCGGYSTNPKTYNNKEWYHDNGE